MGVATMSHICTVAHLGCLESEQVPDRIGQRSLASPQSEALQSVSRNNLAPFTFVLNLIIPGPPWRNLVMSWSADYNPAMAASSPRAATPKSSTAGRSDSDDARRTTCWGGGGHMFAHLPCPCWDGGRMW